MRRRAPHNCCSAGNRDGLAQILSCVAGRHSAGVTRIGVCAKQYVARYELGNAISYSALYLVIRQCGVLLSSFMQRMEVLKPLISGSIQFAPSPPSRISQSQAEPAVLAIVIAFRKT